MRLERRPRYGLALPMVLLLGSACHLMVGLLLESVRGEVRSSGAKALAVEALNAAERTLHEAALRLQGPLAFPVGGCTAGLCANRQAPAESTYDWQGGGSHAPAGSVISGGYWVESLGMVPAGQGADCGGSTGGCEYVRVIASAAPGGVRVTLEACYRIYRSGNASPVVTRISWRDARAL